MFHIRKHRETESELGEAHTIIGWADASALAQGARIAEMSRKDAEQDKRSIEEEERSTGIGCWAGEVNGWANGRTETAKAKGVGRFFLLA